MALAEGLEEIVFEEVEDPNFKEGYVMCMVCREHFKMINSTHLRKHDMSVADYVEQYPNSPLSAPEVYKPKPQECLPIKPDIFVDVDGNKREIGTNKILTGDMALQRYKPGKIDEIKFKDFAATYSEQLFIFLTSIIESKDAKITLNDKFKAADMIHKSMPKPATERVVDSTVKKLTVTIGGSLPDGYKPGDF